MFSVRTFTSFKLWYYAHFWHYAGWQELAKSNAIAKADSNSCLDSQTYDGGSQIAAAVLFATELLPTSIVPKMGVISKFERGESSHRKHV